MGQAAGKARLFDATGASRLPVDDPVPSGGPLGASGGRVVVIGYGNALRSDDAVGREVVEAMWLQRDRLAMFADADFVTATQLTPEMAEEVASARFVLFVDAATDGHPVGCVSVRRVAPAQAPPGERTVPTATCYRDSSPEGLLQMARELYGRAPDAALVTVSVASCEMGTELSPLVRAAVPVAVATAQMAVAAQVPGRLGA